MTEQGEQLLPSHIFVAEFEQRQFSGNALKQCQRIIEESKEEPRKGLSVIRGYVGPPALKDYSFYENKDYPLKGFAVSNCVVVMADVLGERLAERLRMALFTRGKSINLPERVLISLNQQRLDRIQARRQSNADNLR